MRPRCKIILDALPPQTPAPVHRPAGRGPVRRPARTELGQAATFPVRWKIVARAEGYRRRRDPRSRHRLARRICPSGVYRLQLTDAASVDRGRAADRRAGKGLRRRFRPLLAAGGPALRRPLGAQLGDRRFHRPRRPDRTCRIISAPTASASIRCMRCSTIGPAIAAPIRRTAGCFSMRSISMSKNFRNFSSMPRPATRWRG